MELFPAEEYDRLISGLRKLFPTQRYGRDEIDRLGISVLNLFEGGWSEIGLLYRDRPRMGGPLQTRRVPELPEEINTVGVSAHKVLPSAVVLAFDVSLTEAATQHLKALHNRRYLPASRFHTWTPWRKNGWSRSESPAEWGMQDAILEWEARLHAGVESVIGRYLKGFFARSGGVPNRLPVIDTFTVTGLPEGDDEKRLHGTSAWMSSLMLQSRASPFDSYTGKDLRFVWAEDSDERPPVPYRLIEIYSQLPILDDEKSHRDFRLRENLDAVLPYVCFLEAISTVRVQLETLRIRVYRALTRGRFPLWQRFRTDMKLNDRVQKEAMFMSRLALELEDARAWLEHEAHPLADLTRSAIHKSDQRTNLADSLNGSLNFHLDRVRKHLDLVAKTFTDYVSRRNLAVMHRLQGLVVLLTVVATVAAILGIAARWPELKAVLQLLLKR
jgi:hypothetical protein